MSDRSCWRAVLALGVGLTCATTATAQVDAEDLDYDLFADVLVDDPESVTDASFHLLKVAGDASIPLQFSGGAGLTWLDGDLSALVNVKLRRLDRLELGARLDGDPGGGDLSGAVLGLRHQIHRYLAWGINASVKDRSGDSDAGGSFVFMARKRRVMGTALGMKGKLGAGVGDAISVDGVGLRATLETDWEAPRHVTLLAGVKARSVTEDFGGQVGVDGWLAAEAAAPGAVVMRLSLGFGVGGGARQRDLSAALFLVLEPTR
jgi:hypothetical protein